MKKKRRETEVFSVAFLDVITCGFGAIILLLMIAKAGHPVVLEPSNQPRAGTIRKLQDQLFQIRGEAKVLNRDLTSKQEQLSTWDQRVAKLNGRLAGLLDRLSKLKEKNAANSVIKSNLQQALEKLTAEERRLMAEKTKLKTQFIGGIPVDSEYIIFIIDTSGSMFQYAWNKVIDELINTLDVYPHVKGLQIMNDMGQYMFPEYRGRWIPDTPGRRQIIINRIRTWNPYSNSSPVEGITAAIQAYYDPNKKISLYVFGDEFTGRSIQEVVNTVDRLNPKDASGESPIRIHAIGFPTQLDNPPQYQITGIRFAALMRILTHRNGGTFVGLNNYRY